MVEQGELDFGYEPPPRRQHPEHPICIMRWNAELEMVETEWPEFERLITARFKDWHVALSCVLHPLNSHIQLRVRP
jgi:hypothetical protein